MSRWRDVKQGNINKDTLTQENKDVLQSAPLPARIKSFIIDMFLIMMPIMYLTTYVIMSGKDEFQHSPEARWATALIYGTIIVLFWVIKGQTPGYKAYELKLVDNKTLKNVSFLKAVLRYLLFIFSCVTILLALIPFFRSDKKTVQDILTKTTVINTSS